MLLELFQSVRALFPGPDIPGKIAARVQVALKDLQDYDITAQSQFEASLSDAAVTEAAQAQCGTWDQVLDLDEDHHERGLTALREAAYQDPKRDLEGYLRPAPKLVQTVSDRLAEDAAKHLRAAKETAAQQRRSVIVTFEQAATELDTTEDKQHASQIADAMDTLRAKNESSSLNTDLSEKDRKGAPKRDEIIKRVYKQTLQDRLALFKVNELQGIAQAVQDHTTDPAAIQRIMFDGEPVSHAQLNDFVMHSDQHLEDRTVNKWSLVVDKNEGGWGPVSYRLAKFDEGGAFDFERHWFKRDKALGRGELKPAKPAGGIPETMLFVDQVVLGKLVVDTSVFANTFDFKANAEIRTKTVVQMEANRFTALAQGRVLPENAQIVANIDGITDYAGLELIIDWLKEDGARAICFRVDCTGRVFIRVARGTDEVCTRDEVNMIRLLALCVVGTINRAFNTSGDARDFPYAIGARRDVHVDSTCVWPLEVTQDNDGDAPKEQVEWWEGTFTPVRDRHWGAGALPLLGPEKSLETQLIARFAQTAERHVGVMSREAPPEISRKGSSISAALSRVESHFSRSAAALIFVWASCVLLSVFDLSINFLGGGLSLSFSKLELWWITLVFFIICVWRIVAAYCLLNAAEVDAKRTGLVQFFMLNVPNLAYIRCPGMYVGPVLLFAIMGVAITDVVNPIAYLPAWVNDVPNGPQQATFRDAMKLGVWALPVLGIGLLNQTRMMLSRLVTERGTIRRKLAVLGGVDGLVATGARLETACKVGGDDNVPSLFGSVTELKAVLRANLTSKWEQSKRHFDNGSAANATIVALVGLLQPFANMQPNANGYAKTQFKEKVTAFLEARPRVDAMAPGVVEPVRYAALTTLIDAAQTDYAYGADGQENQPLSARNCAIKNAAEITQFDLSQPSDQLLWSLYMMDCMDSSVTSVRNEIATRMETVATLLDKIANTPVSVPEGQTVYNTNVCLFPMGQYCLQDPVLTLGAGQLVSLTGDLAGVKGELKDIADQLAKITTPHEIDLHADAAQARRAIASVDAALKQLPTWHDVTIAADAGEAFREIGFVRAALDSLPTDKTITIKADAQALYDELALLASTLTRVMGPRDVVLGADTEGLYRAISPVVDALSRLPKRHELIVTANAQDVYRDIGLVEAKIDALPDDKTFSIYANAEEAFREVRLALALIDTLPEHHHMTNPRLVDALTRSMVKLLAWLETPPTVTQMHVGPLVTAPLVDVDLAISGTGGGSGTPGPVIAGCHWIARQDFALGSYTVRDDMWTNDRGVLGINSTVREADVLQLLKDYLSRTDAKQHFYVLGLADGSGGKLRNESLAKRRARQVIQHLNGAPELPVELIPLSLGSSGWVAGMPRPLGEIDPNHRSATILACDPDDAPKMEIDPMTQAKLEGQE
ncbi:MAG: hypothetical protein ABJL99_08610 [Aliishimia sp.]